MKRTTPRKDSLAFRVPTVLEFVPSGTEPKSDSTAKPVASINRRIFARTKAGGTATLNRSSAPLKVQVIDMHECGAAIRSNKPLVPGSVVFVQFHEFKLMGFAHVRHCNNRGTWSYAIGLEFRSSLMSAELGRWHFQYRAA
jgi:PilZ domain-containing protein